MALVLLAWIVREVVDSNGGYFSNNELLDWLTITAPVAGACLVAGLAFAGHRLGRSVLVGTVAAIVVVGGGLIGEILLGSV